MIGVDELRDNTPVETYFIRDVPILVKREDLCWTFPALAKARGVWSAIEKRPKANLAVVDTARSLNGQLVATIGMTLGRKVVAGYPVYKHRPNELVGPTLALKSLGVELVPLQANRQFVMRAAMERWLASNKKGKWYLFPTGLRLSESVEAVAQEAARTELLEPPGTVVVPSGTGTHLAGLVKAYWDTNCDFIALLGYKRSESTFRRYVQRASDIDVPESRLRVIIVEDDYYEARPKLIPPFPAHLHYECKTWNWLSIPGVVEGLKQPVLFWNIGA